MSNGPQVIKQSGETQEFDESKLRRSLQSAHAPDEVVDEIVNTVKNETDETISTDKIYERAYELLKEHRNDYAAQYSLRESLAQLGPTGYPFESFVARIFASRGFETEVGVTVAGACCNHEVDVVAQTENTLAFIEAKFHNDQSTKSPVHTPLYVRARFNDIANNDHGRFADKEKTVEYWVVTNTKFSDQAKQYGECAGLKMIGWGYPEDESLEQLIIDANLQPITALTTLSGSHKKDLTKQDLVLCKNLRDREDALKELGFTDNQIEDVMEEVNHLCHI